MKRSLFTTTASTLGLALLAGSLVSCSTMKSAMKKVTSPVRSLAKLNPNDLRRFKLRDLKNDAPPVVEVRKGDLKKMKTGEERILAWNRLKASEKRKYGKINANGKVFMPKDFDPSDLPVGGQIPTYGILPSLNPGDSTAATIDEGASILPPDVANIPDVFDEPGPVPPLPEEKAKKADD